MSNLNGRTRGTSYVGTSANQPPNWHFRDREPNQYDSKNYQLGDLWYDSSATGIDRVWILVGLEGDSQSRGQLADWVQFGGGMGTVVGLRTQDTNIVTPTAGIINVIGSGLISTSGTIGPDTVTISPSFSIAASFPTDMGTATPSFHTLNIFGDHGINTSGSGNTVTVAINNAISLGDLADISLSPALTLQTGDLLFDDSNGSQDPSTVQQIRFSSNTGNDNTINFFLNNVFMGQQAGNLTMTPGAAVFNIGIGPFSCSSITTGTQNIGIGNGTLQDLTSAQNNVMLGYVSGNDITTGNNNIGLGVSTFYNGTSGMTTGSDNIALGHTAGRALTTESNNVLINHSGVAGVNDLFAFETNFQGVDQLFFHNYPGDQSINGGNVFAGISSGNTTVTDIGNCGFGPNTLSNIDAPHNIAVGLAALNLLTTGDGNIAIGHTAGFDPSGPSGLLTGSRNIMIGYTAGSAYTTSESNNITIGTVGVAGENNTITLGQFQLGENPQTRCFIQGIRGIAVTGGLTVQIDANGQLGTTPSSERYKQNIIDMDEYSEQIYDLRPVLFEYKQYPEQTAWGLIAEEVEESFPELVAYDLEGLPASVKYQDLIPLLLNEIQKLNDRISDLEAGD